MTRGAGVLAFVVLLVLVARRRGGVVGTVTTWESYDLTPYGGPVTYGEGIRRMGEAIARAEGFYVRGSIAQRANNPGNLKVPGWQGPTINGISVFASPADGWNALYRQLMLIVQGKSSYYHLDMTILEMGRKWTATVHEQEAWSRNVASFIGQPVTAKLWSVLV